jgi:putative heme iron utilization protein
MRVDCLAHMTAMRMDRTRNTNFVRALTQTDDNIPFVSPICVDLAGDILILIKGESMKHHASLKRRNLVAIASALLYTEKGCDNKSVLHM